MTDLSIRPTPFLKPENTELRGVLNCGHTRKLAFVVRPAGEDHDPKRFSAWAPKALALIGKLPSTLADRSIHISMQRRLPGERIEKLNHFDGLVLRRKCVKWVQNYHPWIAGADPEVPPTLNDRAGDNWAPLLALADLAGGRWPKRARQAALAFSGDQEDESAAILLLLDLRDLFRDRAADRLSSTDIVAHLVTLEERPWPEWGKQHKPITTRQLAVILKSFRIKPGAKRDGSEVFKGYTLRQFKDVFRRYLENTPFGSVTRLQLNRDAGSGEFVSVTRQNGVTDHDPLDPNKNASCNRVTDGKPPLQGNGHDPELLRTLTEACAGLSVTPDDLLAKLDREDYAVVVTDPRLARQLAERLAAE